MTRDLIRHAVYYLELVREKKIFFLIPAALVLIIGIIVVYSMPKIYSSEAVLIVEGQQISSNLVSATVTNERLQLIEQRVLARDNLIGLAERHDLVSGARQGLSNVQIADLVRRNITMTTETPEGSDQSTASSIVHIGFKYDDPELAAAVTSDLVDMLMNETKRLRISRATEATQFLARESSELSAQLRAKEAYRNKFVEDNKDSMPGRIPQLTLELGEKERALSVVETSITSLDRDNSLLEAQLRLGVMNTNGDALRRTQLAALKAQIDEKLLVYSEDHPQVRALRQKMQQLEAMQGGVAKDVASPSTDAELRDPDSLPADLALIAQRIAIAKESLAGLAKQKDELTARIGSLKSIMARAPEVERQLTAMEVDRVSLQRSVDDMNGRLDTARIGERLENDQSAMQMQIIEEPEVPKYPSSSRRLLGVAFVLALAGGAGAAGVVIADIFTSHIRGTFDLAEALQGQTLVVIPEWSSSGDESHAVVNWANRVVKELRGRPLFPWHSQTQDGSTS
ncbi:hypothetical protein QTL95_03100 [Rhizobium sp. S152]|uniref:GumC family protein n=1 Tax=Rhizobium sp. S152 TaxID=3055038 RepID=UPI0025A97260|nr:hypothetical protein [Rhizobium sp. S152]MDM9624869.1 hypothetical protein [Rhizobium sp. S152]